MAGSARKTDRSRWPVRRSTLAAQPGDDLSATTTPEARLAMMWPLALEAWKLAGLPFPAYGRNDTPVRVVPLPTDTTRAHRR